MGIDDIELGRSQMALLGGAGLVAIIGYFWLLLLDKSAMVYLLAIVVILLSTLMVIFFLLDKTRFAPDFITDANSNLIAGMFGMALFFINLVTFTKFTVDPFDGVLILILSLLTATTVFLFMASILLDD